MYSSFTKQCPLASTTGRSGSRLAGTVQSVEEPPTPHPAWTPSGNQGRAAGSSVPYTQRKHQAPQTDGQGVGRGGGGSQHLGLSTWVLQGAGSADGRAHPCRALGHSGAQKSHSRRGQAARLCSRDSRFKAGSGRRWARETVRMGALNKTAISSEMSFRGFPGGPVVRTLRFHCRGHGFKPWSGKIPHAAEQLGP